MPDLHVPDTWTVLADDLAGGPSAVLVIGAADAGKSTFCGWLARHWAQAGQRLRLIDADVGQSRLGPPGTVGCAWFGKDGPGEPVAFFVGDISPRRALPEALAAVGEAAREAGSGRAVIDSTGWVTGPEAVALKRAKAALLGEAHVVLIEREDELRAFRRAWRGLERFPVHLLRALTEVRRRSPEERRAHREAAFRAHLTEAVECGIDLRQVAASGPGPLHLPRPAFPEGLLLGLNDARGRLLSLGVLCGLDPATGQLTCRCRPEGAGAAEVRFGRLLIRPDGTHTPLAETDEGP